MGKPLDFEVGDLVVRDTAHEHWLDTAFGFDIDPGPYRVMEFKNGGKTVKLDRGPPGRGYQNDPYWTAHRFKLAPPSKVINTTPKKDTDMFIIIVKNNIGKLAPAMEPRTYNSEAQAKVVARSMAESHPGNTFVVFKAFGESYVAPKPAAAWVQY